eukprot:scaffold56589_cov18-Prasinocladus_malaysianus.AAC.1
MVCAYTPKAVHTHAPYVHVWVPFQFIGHLVDVPHIVSLLGFHQRAVGRSGSYSQGSRARARPPLAA